MLILWHYIVLPKFKEFISDLNLYAMLFAVKDGRSEEVVTGKMA